MPIGSACSPWTRASSSSASRAVLGVLGLLLRPRLAGAGGLLRADVQQRVVAVVAALLDAAAQALGGGVRALLEHPHVELLGAHHHGAR